MKRPDAWGILPPTPLLRLFPVLSSPLLVAAQNVRERHAKAEHVLAEESLRFPIYMSSSISNERPGFWKVYPDRAPERSMIPHRVR